MPKIKRKKTFARRSSAAEGMARLRKSLTVEEIEKQREYNAQNMRAKRKSLTVKEVEKQKEYNAQSMRAKRKSESVEEADKRREENALRIYEKRKSESVEEADKRREENALRIYEKRKSESVEEADKRREENALRIYEKRKSESVEEANKRREENACRMYEKRLCMSSDERRTETANRSLRKMTCNLSPMPDAFRSSLNRDVIFENTLKSMEFHTCIGCNKSTLSTINKTCGNRCQKFSGENDMDPGPVPPELATLTYLEEQLIARVHPVISVYRIRGHQIGYSGHVINFPQDIKEFATLLPHRISDLTHIIAVRVQETVDRYHDFHVRAGVVRTALMWLKSNNPFYFDIILSEENLGALPHDGNVYDQISQTRDIEPSPIEEEPPPPQVESTSVPLFRLPHQDDQVLTVLNWPTVGQVPIDEFNTPGYIVQAFPKLFPTGKADFGAPRTHKISVGDYFKHLLQFHDRRFADDPRFRFFALNTVMRWTALSNGNLFIRHHEELRGKTVKELKELVAACPSLIKKIMCYGTKIRGTRAYWRARLTELLEMENQLGLPTLFMTLSAADLHWPDLIRLMDPSLSEDEVQEMSEQDRRQLLASTPIVPSHFFYERTEFFLDKILRQQFDVIDHWRRYEWQHRGSPHIHMLLWLRDAPATAYINDMSDEERNEVVSYFDNLISTINPGLHQRPAEVHPCRKRLQEVNDRQLDLSELVNKVQRHTKCSENYCLRKHKTTGQLQCRYHFPFDLCEESHLAQDDKGQVHLVTKRNDPLVNKYNPWALQLWRANIDVTPVLTKDAFLNYIAKYASKAEVKSKTMTELFDNTLKTLEDQDPARKAIQRVLIQMCAERDFSSQEVIHLTTGKKLFSASRAFVKVIFKLNNDWVPVGPDHDIDGEEETESFNKRSFIEKYIKRPYALEDVSLWEAASLFTPKRRGPWSRRRVPAIVCVHPKRRLTTDRNDREEYYRQHVLLRIPWRTELDAKGRFESWEDAYKNLSHMPPPPPSSGAPPPPEDDEYEDVPSPPHGNDDPPEEWMVVAGKGPDGVVRKVEPGRREIDLRYDWGTATFLYGDPSTLRSFLSKEKDRDVLPQVEYANTAVTLTASQNQVMRILENQILAITSNNSVNIQLLIIQGKAGCGKSTLIRTMTAKLSECLGNESFLLLAPTGSAALNINGRTIHSALHIPVRSSDFRPLEGGASRNFLQEMAHVRFLIVDEYSMIGLTLLGMMEQRCSEANPYNSEVFGGINIFLIGDLCQLPPVRSKPIYSTEPKSDTERRGMFAYSKFCHAVILKESMRQTDNSLREALDELARGSCSLPKYQLFCSRFKRFLSPEDVAMFNNSTHIFAKRQSADEHNKKMLLNLHGPIARIPANHNNSTARHGSVDDAFGLEEVLYLAKGARVVLRANLWVKAGLVNGSQGIIVDIVYDCGKSSPEDLPTALVIRFDNYKGPSLPGGLVPIPPMTRTWTTGRVCCSREQMPVSLSWGSTVHQSQGQTYDRVAVDIGPKEFQVGLSYVALSRARTIETMLLHPEFLQKRLDYLKYKKSLKNKLNAIKKIETMARKLCTPEPPPPQPSPSLPPQLPPSLPPQPSPSLPPQPSPSRPPQPPLVPQPPPAQPSIAGREVISVAEGRAEIQVIPGDGHCMFSAILHQLGQSQPGGPRNMHAVRQLRRRVADFIRRKLQQPDNESLQAPRFITQPSGSSNIVSEGRTKILQCQALGYPQPQYRWLKDGVELGDFSTEHFYRIHNTRREDGGRYQCVARNDVGSILSKPIDVSVAYMGVFEDQSERTVAVSWGEAAVLELPQITSHPQPLVIWQADDGSQLYGRKYAVTHQHQLIVLSVTDSDQKAYRARATNTQLGKEENSAYVRLVVRGGDPGGEIAPEIIVSPRDSHILKDTLATELQCIVNARPLHELETLWLKDGIPVENTGINHNLNDPWNRTLSLVSANLTHTGRYTCQARLRSGGFPAVEATAQVTVLEAPSFISSLRPETLGEYGNTVKLPCEASGEPAPSIQWLHNAVDVMSSTHRDRYLVEEDKSLVIKKLRMEDTGMYQCVATNEAGSDFVTTWLKVKTSAPIMETPPQNVTVLDGKDAIITCRVAGAPTPNITWYYQDSQPVEASGRLQVLESGDLLVAAVRESDAGKYACVRANEAGQVTAAGYLSVLVRTQIIQPPVDTRVLLGNTATLQCKVSSDPSVPYQIDWFHNGQPVGVGSQRVSVAGDGTLEIQAVRAADVGDYTCALVSPGGNETRTARLSVIELPFPPTNLVATRLDSRAVNLTWAPGFDGNSEILKYIVQRREVSDLGPITDNWVTELSNVSASNRWVLLRNLKAAASYQFRVSAVNSVGEGSPSDPSNVIALPQEPPSGPPIGFAGSARSSSEIITQWQPPIEEHRNGQILGYVIRYRLYGYNESPWNIRNITNEAQHNYLVQGLITWKDYVLQIAAYNNKGVGVFSDGIRIKTKEGVPEAPPTEVRAEAVNSTAVQVWWKPPHPQKINGINQGYKLQAYIGDTVSRVMTVPPSLFDPLAQQSAVMPGLRKFTTYNLTVLCFTDPGDGLPSHPVEVTTQEDVPDEVGGLHFEDISDRAVKVVWLPPERTNGILTGYTLSYMVKDKPDTLKTENFTADTLSVMVTQLQATTHYRLEVNAWTSVGAGPRRVATIQSGVEPVLPSPPTKLAVTNIEAFSVVLQFTPGFDGNSSITKWIVEAQTARNTSWFPVFEESSPDAMTLTVVGLVPFTLYRLRLIARNVVGPSEPSEPTKEFQTIQAPPSHAPHNVTVRALSDTELRVRWIPLQQSEWFGNPRGYNISYREAGSTASPLFVIIEDHTANSHVLDKLEEFAQYEIVLTACNDVGVSAPSPVALERTRESVPSFGPMNVAANATSSTTIVVKWGDVPRQHRNGQIEGYKVIYGTGNPRNPAPPQEKDIPSNRTFTTTLTELRKFVVYSIQVLAYTRLGDGTLSTPPIRVQTFEDVPGPPSNVSFPDVSLTTARIIWDVPEEPNGEILAYRVSYHLQATGSLNFSREFPPSDRTYRATELEPEQYYLFSVTAQTRLGWGKQTEALVYTTNNRETPQPPSAPQLSRSQVQATQITFSWAPGRDGYAPLRYYTVQLAEGIGPWVSVQERVDPSVTSYTATGLKPYTSYRFRIQATNDIGPSGWSVESAQVRTLPAAPSKGVNDVKVIPITTTSVRVEWTAIPENYWSGDPETGGYRIVFQPVSDFPTSLQATPKQEVKGIQTTSVVLTELSRDHNYEIVVVPFNSQGAGPASPPVAVYVGEAVPTGRPRSVTAEPVSSTEVRLHWLPPQQKEQNGDLLGYKIFYLAIELSQELDPEDKVEEELEVVPASYTGHSLVFLDKFTKYRIQILAFNPAGDGPRSQPIEVKTLQGLPGPPRDLRFSDITMTSLLVSWDPPQKRNGELIGYIVTYETAEQNERFSKQVKQKVSETSLLVQTLEEEVTYTFTVRAQTIDYGPAVKGNVTTGPQEGSPTRPKELTVGKTVSSVELHWVNGASGKGPILGYYFQSKRKDDTRWTTVTRTGNGPLQEFAISYQSLLPSTAYNFRVISYNKYGISYPANSDDVVLTPSKLYLEYGYLQMKPFYRQTWFMVALAATSIVIIIMVVAVLCVKSKSYKYKQEAQKTLEESMAMDIDDRQQLAMELYRGGGTLGKRTSLARKHLAPPGPPMLGKSPPRPSPASVAYHSDEESLKGYDENPDDSSVTEKPSEISSSESQGSESENESVRSDPHSFVNHYANVNDSLRQSWKRQKPVRNYSSYTDSEPEGSGSAVVSLNGGQIIMNNMARSRAPLPGFSSFV